MHSVCLAIFTYSDSCKYTLIFMKLIKGIWVKQDMFDNAYEICENHTSIAGILKQIQLHYII